MPRPKGSKKEKYQLSSPVPSTQFYANDDLNWIRTSKKCEYDETNFPISSSSETNGSRVVVNPAVLRYLEQNRNLGTINKNLSMDIMEERQETSVELHLFTNDDDNETNDFIRNDRFWDLSTYSTEYLTSIQLAEWILCFSSKKN